MDQQTRIILNPDILVGKPIIRGTRLAVEFIIDLLAQGWSTDEILRNYPGISLKDIQACLSYASAMLKAEKVYAIPVVHALPCQRELSSGCCRSITPART
ncbi:MAG: DUF433 domain-containing protein [Microcoleaceae cyanobacterium]